MSGDEPAGESGSRWTLGQIRARNFQLEARCQAPGCPWFGVFDLDMLIDRAGPDYELPDSPGVPCQKCGGPLKFQLAVLHPDDNGTA